MGRGEIPKTGPLPNFKKEKSDWGVTEETPDDRVHSVSVTLYHGDFHACMKASFYGFVILLHLLPKASFSALGPI